MTDVCVFLVSDISVCTCLSVCLFRQQIQCSQPNNTEMWLIKVTLTELASRNLLKCLLPITRNLMKC